MSREDRLREMIMREGDVEFETSADERYAATRVLEARRRLAVAVTPRERERAQKRLGAYLERQALVDR